MIASSITPYSAGFAGPSTETNPYTSSVAGTEGDYADLMKRYRAMLDKGPDQQLGNLAAQYQNMANTPLQYQRGPDQGAAMANMGELAKTGGYSEQGINDLRARGVSPIRAVYANAMEGINRQKSLQGGYSPNYTAAMAKMTRDMSEGIANQTSNVNAGIAQNVAGNRLSAAPQYASAASNETGMMNDVAARSAANKMGALNSLSDIYGRQNQQQQQGLQGMTSLYGTTPARPALYGQQALGRAQLDEQAKNRQQQGSIALMNSYPRR